MNTRRRDVLWRLVTGREGRSGTPEEMFVDIARLVFNPNLAADLSDMGTGPSGEKEGLLRDYVETSFPDGLVHSDGVPAYATDIIDEMRKANCEPPDKFTYELSLAARICRPWANIVLVGPTGSGKTFKLSYVWHKYISKLSHCSQSTRQSRCRLHERIRLRFDVDATRCADADDLYDQLYNFTISELERKLGQVSEQYLDECFAEFLTYIYRPESVLPSYCGILHAHGLTPGRVRAAAKRPSDMPRLESVYDSCRKEDKHYRELLQLVLRFCGWLRDRYLGGQSHCLYMELDNVDASHSSVHSALVELLETCDPRQSALLVCACRTATLASWTMRRVALDVVWQKGLTAHNVIMARMNSFIESFGGCAEDSLEFSSLQSRLHNLQPPRTFIDNMADLRDELTGHYFRAFFEDTFGQQIRSGLVFAAAIVAVAGRLTRDEMSVLTSGRSVYALERLLYRPLGMNSASPGIPNIFVVAPRYEHRLLGLRILTYLMDGGTDERRLQEICLHLKPFATQDDVITAINNLIRLELILPKTPQLRISPDDTALLRVTDTGRGLSRLCYSYSFVCGLMYYAVCNSDYQYPPYSIEEREGEPRLRTVFDTLVIFLREMSDIEYADLARARGNITDGRTFAETYGPNTLMHDFYERAAIAICRIAMAADHELLLADASYLVQQYEAWLDRVAQDFPWPRQAVGAEYSVVVEDLRAVQMRASDGGADIPTDSRR